MGVRLFVWGGIELFVNHGLLSAARGQGTSTGDAGKPLTVEASLNLRGVGDLQFSGDGRRLAFAVTEPAKGTGRWRRIWIYDAGGGVARQFTFSGKSELAPRWRPEPSASPSAAE